jgi:hypothetical protein
MLCYADDSRPALSSGAVLRQQASGLYVTALVHRVCILLDHGRQLIMFTKWWTRRFARGISLSYVTSEYNWDTSTLGEYVDNLHRTAYFGYGKSE